MSAPSFDPLAVPTPAPPSIGEIVPLGSVVVKVDVSALTTMPDTPNGYTAALKVMADQGDLNSDALAGPQGPAGDISFAVRESINPEIFSPAQLPILSNSPTDIGRYYLLEDLDDFGNIVGQSAYIWYGTSYRRLMMGAYGPPGPVPDITPEVELIPQYDDKGNVNASYIQTSGPRLEPTWEFFLAAPAGPVGPITPLYIFPDVDEVTKTPVTGDLMGFTGKYTESGFSIWQPEGISALLPQTYSMPEAAFSGYFGVAQQAPVGSFTLPPQPFPWTPIVWGHIGETGLNLSADPLRIGCEVLLGDPANGKMISRGIGTMLGHVNIFPHYSTSYNNVGSTANSQGQAITPKNQYAMIPANHTNPADSTLYVNLWNDGQLGLYFFQPGGAQLFIMVLPLGPIPRKPQRAEYPLLRSEGFFYAFAEKGVSMGNAAGQLLGMGTLSAHTSWAARFAGAGTLSATWHPGAPLRGTGTLSANVTHIP